MASIRKRGNTYQITVHVGRDSAGKQMIETATFKPDPSKTPKQNEKALQKFALDFEEKAKTGKLFSGDKMPYKDYIEIWKKEYCEKQLEKTTLETQNRLLNDIIIPSLGHYKLTELKPLHIQKFYDMLLSGTTDLSKVRGAYNPSSVRRIHNIISSSLTTAVHWQLIDDNPCRRVKPPKLSRNSSVKNFNLEEAQTFLQYLEEPYETLHGGRGDYGKTACDMRKEPLQLVVLFNLALFGGFRRGELLALTWKDVDFEHNTITINKSLAKTKNDGVIIKGTKNSSSQRVVSMPAECMAMLKRLNLQQKAERLRLGSAWKGQDNVFYQSMGDYMDIGTPNHSFKRIIKRYNATHSDQLPLISFHGLRHSSATLLISQNNDIKTVSARLGHADVSTTMDIYSHALKERDQKAAQSLNILFKQQA